LEFARIVYSNELSSAEKNGKSAGLDGNILKKITSGGDVIMARKLFSNEISLKIQCTFFMMANSLPDVIGSDGQERMFTLLFPGKFVNEDKIDEDPRFRLKDDTIKSWLALPEVGDEIILDILDSYTDEMPTPPQQVIDEQLEDAEDNDDNEFYKEFTFGNPNDIIASTKMTEIFRGLRLNIQVKKMRQLMKRRCVYKPVRVDGKVTKCYAGVRFNRDLPDED
jgi:phage/plasmid-associated DNA primase